MIVPNRAPYDLWELRRVSEHLMLIPKQHVSSLSELPEPAQVEALQLMSEYETNGYNIYARGIENAQRSEEHQHTHLIKTTGKRARGSLLWMKPYFLKRF